MKAVGYRAHVLPEVAEVYLRLRDHHISVGTPVPKPFRDIITACDLLTRALAQVGIAALVDEATGYQAVREHDALQRILDQWLNGYARKWAKTFPDMFWEKLLRAKGYDRTALQRRRCGRNGADVSGAIDDRHSMGIKTNVVPDQN